jgi:F-type H+-transporting ATPase subunit c
MNVVDSVYLVKAAKYIAAALCIALGGLGPALGQGYIGSKSCESISKAPEHANIIKNHALLSMIFVETSTIFSFVIAICLLFVAN